MILKEFNSPSGKHVIIRDVDHDDAKNIIAYSTHILATFKEFVLTTPEEFKPTVDEQKKWIDDHNAKGFLAVAEADRQIAGMIHLMPHHRKKASHYGEFALSVREGYHDQRIGQELLKSLIHWARSGSSIEKIILNVNASNEKALYLYKKLGFVEEGFNKKAVKQPDGRYTDNVQMALFV